MPKIKNSIFIHVLIPMLIGGFIYILFRNQNLLMFRWFEFLGLDNIIKYYRGVIDHNMIPFWIKYSLPDGVWVYSLTSLMLIIWYNHTGKLKYFWIFFGPFFGLFLEFGQLVNIVPGTYDNMDLTLTLSASIIPFIIFNFNLNRSSK